MSTSTFFNEKELLNLSAQGDEAAFTQLFYAYHQKIGAYIFQLTASREITEEIVQEVFIKLWIQRERLATVERFGTYIYVLSRNHALNFLRQLAKERVRNKLIIATLKQSTQYYEKAEPVPDYYTLIDKAVAELPPQQKKVYLLSRHERLKYDEIAQKMSISRESVKKYLQLATKFISNYLRKHKNILLSIFLLLTAYCAIA